MMVESFKRAGFTGPDVRYTLEEGDPFAAITRLGASREDYVILVHQDVRCDLGYSLQDLAGRLEELTQFDSTWAVAGNAGVTRNLTYVRHLSDLYGASFETKLPRKVVSLDENFLVLRTARGPRCSSALSGVHLYGSDVCLTGASDGSSSYVIDFRISHLGGTLHRAGVDRPSEQAFEDFWSPHYAFKIYIRASGTSVLSRYTIVRRMFGSRSRRIISRIAKKVGQVRRALAGRRETFPSRPVPTADSADRSPRSRGGRPDRVP